MRTLAPALLLIAAAPAMALADDAAPLASAQVDVDGDGKADKVTVDGTGVTVKLHGKKGESTQRFASSGTLTSAEITSGGKGKQPFVAISARFRDGDRELGEGLVLRWQKGALAEVWRGEVGPVGRDGDYEYRVAATAAGLVRSQRRAGYERCDGVTAELFREGWDDKAEKFRPIRGDVTIAAGATTLTATRTAPEGAPTLSAVYRAAAASTEAGAGDASQLGTPHQLDDGDPATAWREDRGGDGRGEFVTYRARSKGAKVAALRILPGDARGATEMAASNRLARIAVVTAGHAYWIDLADEIKGDDAALAAWWVTLPAPIAADCVTVLWAGFHPGKGAAAGTGTSIVAELVVLGEEDVAPGGAAAKLIADVIAGGLAGDSASKLLARRGGAAARAVEDTLAKGGLPGDAEVRLWRVLAAIGDPGSAAVLGAGLTAAGVSDDDARAIAEGLGGLGDAGQAELARVLGDAAASGPARRAAAGAIDDEHRDAMVAALGTGPWDLRKTLVMRVAAAGVTWLLAAAAQAAVDGTLEREADLWRAVGLAAQRGDDAERRLALDALAARGRESTHYELRYRIVAALAPLGDLGDAGATALDALRAIILDPAQNNESAAAIALRQVAAAALTRSTAADAARFLVELAADADPGVRIAALHALAGRDDLGDAGAWTSPGDVNAVDRVLVNALAGDTWPEVRHTAAAALAIACPRKGPTTALETAAEEDADDGVRADALAALVTCDAPGIADRLLATAHDGKTSLTLRDRAVDLLGVLGDPSVAPTLVKDLARWRNASFSEVSALVLAQRAAVVLGRLGALSGDRTVVATIVDALLDTAEDGAFPELQAAGAAGLGELGANCTKDARALLRELSTSEQAAVKVAAKRALGSCGK